MANSVICYTVTVTETTAAMTTRTAVTEGLAMAGDVSLVDLNLEIK